MIRRTSARATVAAALTLLAAVPFASTAAAQPSVAELVTPREARLSNGLRLLSLTDPKTAVSTLQVYYDVGSRNERPGITGISHLFEHMMFKGTKKVAPEEHARMIQAVGGVNNASTTWDLTVYWQALPPDQLELAARLEADRMANLSMTPEHLASEREVVKEERRFRTDNSPIGKAAELLSSVAYDSHPYGWPTVGWMKDLDAITFVDCRDYYAIHYAPDKATIVIAGPTTHEQNLKLVEKYFKGLKPGAPAPRVPVGEVAQKGERRAELHTEVQLPFLVAGFKVPPDSSADAPTIEIISNLLSNGQSSRLYRKLVYEDQSARIAAGHQLPRKDGARF